MQFRTTLKVESKNTPKIVAAANRSFFLFFPVYEGGGLLKNIG